MQRLSPKAVARELSESYDDLKSLTRRELDLVQFALRFCPVPDILARLDADAARHCLKKITDIT